MEEPHALIERRGHVLIVTMNRPAARNALSGPMMELMRQAWDTVDSAQGAPAEQAADRRGGGPGDRGRHRDPAGV
jgi:enoyl-CoA hydratase/carnithine racemase